MFGIKSCHRIGLFYTGQVRLNWNFLRLAMLAAFDAVRRRLCRHQRRRQRFRPPSFFLPGLMKADPPAATNAPVAVSEPFQQLALAR